MKKLLWSAGVIITITVVTVLAFNTAHRTTHTVVTNKNSYVALGDSVAAGVGLKYDSDSSACDRTDQAYPHLLAQQMDYKLVNLSCSGATLTSGILGTQNVNELLVKPQLDQLFSNNRPDIITMTIGANDIGWTSILARCYTSECGTADDDAMLQDHLATMSTNLEATLMQIQQHYSKNIPKIFITGYHQVFPTSSGANCTDLVGIDASELSWGRQLQSLTNNAIQATVNKFSFATFVPVDFAGHELCTSDPWVQGLGDQQPYHPTEMGQSIFAKAVVTAIKGNSKS